MEKKFITPFKVGLVVVAGLIVAVVMITRVTSQWGNEDNMYLVHAYFNDVTGLAEKSQVRIAGIAVGEIARIELVNNRARITLSVLKSVDLFEGLPQPTGIYRDGATIQKKLSSLLGDYYVEITPGLQGEKLEDGDEIKNVIEGGGPEAILSEVEKITRDVSEITGTLAEVFGGEDGRQRINAIFRDVEDISQSVRELTIENADRLDRIVDNVEKLTVDARVILRSSGEDVDAILGDMRSVARDLREIVDSSGGRLDRGFDELDTTMASARSSLEKLDRSLANFERISQGVADGEGTVGRIFTDDTIANKTEELLTDTKVLVATATEAVDAANEVIGSISRLDTIVDLRNDYMVGTGAFKNVFALKLQPRPTKWYQIELVHDPRGNTTKIERDVDGNVVTIKETTSDFKLSFQFAGRYEWLAGRFGVIENTGGLGSNVYFFDDNLELVVDVFDFSTSAAPRMRAFSMLYFDTFLPWTWTEYLYLSGGVDDVMNTNTLDYFMGVGISFNDKDLKGLLTVTGAPTP